MVVMMNQKTNEEKHSRRKFINNREKIHTYNPSQYKEMKDK